MRKFNIGLTVLALSMTVLAGCSTTTSNAETPAETTTTVAEPTTEATTEEVSLETSTDVEQVGNIPSEGSAYTQIVFGPAHMENEGEDMLIVDNQSTSGYTGDIMIPVTQGEGAPLLLNATTGLPVNLTDFENDSMVYAYISDAMTMSLPPMTNARVIFCNIPADYRVPEYVIAATTEISEDGNFMVVTGTNGKTYTIDAITAEITPYLTRNIVTLADISTDTSLIIWTGDDEHVSKVVVFADGFFGENTQSDNAKTQ